MAGIEAAKMTFLHKKVVDRYVASPSSDDEDMIMVFDTQGDRPEGTYSAMGYQQHPVFERDNWVSEVAAKMTDIGYWAWVGEKITKTTTYRYDGVRFRESIRPTISPPPPTMGRSIFDDGEVPGPTIRRLQDVDEVRTILEQQGHELPYAMPAVTNLQP